MKKKNLLFVITPLLLLGCSKEVMQSPQLKVNATQNLHSNSVGNVYYLDPAGSDSNNGLSTLTPWKTLAKVNGTTFNPGDEILLKSGGVWSGTLSPKGSGSSGSPIVIDMYGTGNKPVINGPGTNNSCGFLLDNQSYWEIHNLEVTNTQAIGGTNGLKGMNVRGGSTTAINHIYIQNCYVHDVNSVQYGTGGNTYYGTIYGAIIYQGYINDVLVSDCHIANSSVCGLKNNGAAGTAATNVVFQKDTVENIYGNGIVMCNVQGGLIKSNVIHNACMSQDVNVWFAACWTFNSTQSTISYNEVYGLTGGYTDGEAFDADSNTNGDIFEYNYSHDNSRGFMELMPTSQNIIVRYNVSVNDCTNTTGTTSKLYNYRSTSTNNQIYNNTFYLTNNIAHIFYNDGTAQFNAAFNNNIIYTTATVGAFSKNNGTSTSSIFNNNCFYPASITSVYGPPAGTISGTINSDPSFVNPGAHATGLNSATGYQLNSGSPCYNAGVVISANRGIDYSGHTLPVGNPDIGAFQH